MITLTGLLQTSLSAGIVILAVCLLSRPLKGRYQSKYRKTIWLLISLRLLIPVNSPVRPWTLHIPLKNFTDNTLSGSTLSGGTLSGESSSAKDSSGNHLSDITLSNQSISSQQTGQSRRSDQQTAKEQTQPIPSQNQRPYFRHPFMQYITQPDRVLTHRAYDTNQLFLLIWAVGAMVFAAYHIVCCIIFHKKLAAQKIPCSDQLLQTAAQTAAEAGIKKLPDIQLRPHADTAPFLAGIIHPCLILPKECYEPEDLYFILKHELIHYAQKDIWYKLLFTFVHVLHWFNPLVWIMHSMADCDLEKSCDEEVLNGLSFEQRKAYSEVILACISEHNALHPILSTGCAVRTKQIKDRFSNILDHTQKRTAPHSILGAAFLIFFSSGLIHITQASSIDPSSLAQPYSSSAQGHRHSPQTAAQNKAQADSMPVQNATTQSSNMSAEHAAGTADMDAVHFETTKELYSLLGLSIGDGQDLAVTKLSEPADRFYEVIGTAGSSPQCLHTYMFYKDCMIIVKDFFEKNIYEEQNGIFEIELSGRHRSYKTSKGIRIGDPLQKVRQKYQAEGLRVCSYDEPGLITDILRDRTEKTSVYTKRKFTYDYGTFDQAAYVLSPVRYQNSNNTPALIFLIHDNKVTRIIMTNINADYP